MKHILLIYIFVISIVEQNCVIQLRSLSPKCIEEYNSGMIVFHNKMRSLHVETPNLVENKTLNSIARSFSEYLAKNELFEHSRQQNLGENLGYTWSSHQLDLTDCKKFSHQFVDMWYDEIKHYKFDSPGFSSDTGHFTQIVWKSSHQLGCGLTVTTDNRVYGVCNYFPQGNVINPGFFEGNVLPLKSSASSIVNLNLILVYLILTILYLF